MSALPPKADIDERISDVCFVLKADIRRFHSTTSSASNCIWLETVSPSALAVLRLITRSNFVGCRTSKIAHFLPPTFYPLGDSRLHEEWIPETLKNELDKLSSPKRIKVAFFGGARPDARIAGASPAQSRGGRPTHQKT